MKYRNDGKTWFKNIICEQYLVKVRVVPSTNANLPLIAPFRTAAKAFTAGSLSHLPVRVLVNVLVPRVVVLLHEAPVLVAFSAECGLAPLPGQRQVAGEQAPRHRAHRRRHTAPAERAQLVQCGGATVNGRLHLGQPRRLPVQTWGGAAAKGVGLRDVG